ncbi:Heat shock factor binding 1 [Penicillium samsonianum]|uniref:Heat shock factor binding 1 n=1 Tax=Penicillium samsonianum TaxID=1882272 RepID=UPI0025471590|nr:Heat shock factor binding 1 [Penicillium samsonianum]KAJ6139667.1 Heat shock factor binding 1 [Penicillium samsonianum]
MVDDSKSPSPDKLESSLPEGESLLSQPNSDAQGQLTAAVDDLLNELQSKFDNVSTEMFGKLDEMTKRLDELEASLTASSGTGVPTPAK